MMYVVDSIKKIRSRGKAFAEFRLGKNDDLQQLKTVGLVI